VVGTQAGHQEGASLDVKIAAAITLLSVLGAINSEAFAQASLIVLARHAEKAAPTGDVGLSPAGVERAGELARAVAGVRFSSIITTQYQRTRLTAAPVAGASGVTPTVMTTSGDVRADAAAIARAIDSLPAGAAVLVIGHSNTLGPIIAALGGPRIPDLCDGEYSRLLILARPQGGPVNLVQASYGAGDPPRSGECAE
jgi:broad specificity phosphatase PhoE